MVTAITKGQLKDKDLQSKTKKAIRLERPGKASELAGLAIYLASDASSYVTGSIIPIDGGWTCHL